MTTAKRRIEGATRSTAKRIGAGLWACALAALIANGALPTAGVAADVVLVNFTRTPYNHPRPGAGQDNVPLRTSYYMEVRGPSDRLVPPTSVTLSVRPQGGAWTDMLQLHQQFAPGYSGDVWPFVVNAQDRLAIYVDGGPTLAPSMTHDLRLTAATVEGDAFPGGEKIWSFTTEAAPATHPVAFSLDTGAAPQVTWDGAFFSGFVKPGFATSYYFPRTGSYERMLEVQQQFPKAWTLQRDWYITSADHVYGEGWFIVSPNVVRELETRRIVTMEPKDSDVELLVEDFFGHQQYGIASGRPLSDDYHPGDEVLIADGVKDVRVTVVAVDDAASTVLLSTFDASGWVIDYATALPTQENPDAPGLFPPGGTYLRKFAPTGTPRYYWGRVDKEYDLVHGTYGRRLVVSYCDAPGDLAIDGRKSTTAKDYEELHQVIYDMTDHLLTRYGAACLDFVWSIGNEWNHGVFWRSSWDEAQRFYDYTADAILRAFEDHGLDSSQVFLGGLELGGSGNLFYNELRDFLAHCSPTAAPRPGALPQNAAYIDARLNGKRSQLIEDLCGANGGKGTPVHYISRHCYWDSKTMADYMTIDKGIALEIDPVYYGELYMNSFESCPSWNPPQDIAADDSYLGNGYFTSWSADVVRRQLGQAVIDPRYAYGETILTFWPWVFSNFNGMNGAVQRIDIDSDNDGAADTDRSIGLPILYYLGYLSALGPEYAVLPVQTQGDFRVSGFATTTPDQVGVLLYSHQTFDTQSRSDAEFDVTLNVTGLDWTATKIEQFRFDDEINSAFPLIETLRDRDPRVYTPAEIDQVQAEIGPSRTSAAGYATPGGMLLVSAPVDGNGSNFVILSELDPPGIASHPDSLVVLEGQPASMTVAPNGIGPFTYQWKVNGIGNVHPIYGGNAPTVGVARALLAYSGYALRCEVGNAAGIVVSNSATLTVVPLTSPPVITKHPTTVTVDSGAQASMSVEAIGKGPLNYVWYWNGGPVAPSVPGARAATIGPATVLPQHSGTLYCRVSNSNGSTQSQTATLTVNP